MIIIDKLVVRRGLFSLKNISFTVGDAEILVVMGPNGSGKTTLLEAIAGLLMIDSGRILINGEDVTRKPPEKRRVGYVPSDAALFPGMTVRKNLWLAYRKTRGLSTNELNKIIKLLNIEALLDRRVEELSSGEKQRVALARALASNPSVLLLDEPLSMLDPPTRDRFKKELREILAELFQDLGLSVIYTTHDLAEATVIGDKIAVINNGFVEQISNPRELLDNPRSRFIADFLGYNVIDGVLTRIDDKELVIDAGEFVLRAEKQNKNDFNTGEKVLIIIKPSDIVVLKPTNTYNEGTFPPQLNIINGIIRRIFLEKESIRLEVNAGLSTIKVEAPYSTLNDFVTKPGNHVQLYVNPANVKIITMHKDEEAHHHKN